MLTGAIAAVAVLIAGTVALPLVRGAAQAQARVTLAGEADLIQEIATRPNDFEMPNGHPSSLERGSRALAGIVGYLRVQGVTVEAVIPGTVVPQWLDENQIAELALGENVSSSKCAYGKCVFIEARPVGVGTGIALIQPVEVTAPVMSSAVNRIASALIIGFLVALFAGFVIARRLARPLADAAQAARKLRSGERNVRITPEGPAEVAEIAVALNELAESLLHSEDRQREFFLSISHELRTPLTAIRGYAEAIADGLVDPDDTETVGNVMTAEALRLDRLVSDLLDLARSDADDFPLHMQQVSLKDLVTQAGMVWHDRAARENVVFTCNVPEHDIVVNTDPLRARQIIDNLAENALRVTPAGSPMILELTSAGVVEVRDGGPGLTEDDIAVAFDPGELYERYKGVRRVGTGFGLALVARLAARLGATAWAGESPEGGAAFRIDFSPVNLPLN